MKLDIASSEKEIQPEVREQTSRPLIAYSVHLLVPTFLLIDTTTAWLRGELVLKPWNLEVTLALVSAMWLVTGLGFLFLSLRRPAILQRAATPLISIYAIYLAVIAMEGASRLMGVAPPIPGLQEPGIKAVTTADSEALPGISGKKVFTTNQLGLRGPIPPKDGLAYKILAVGASTTLCANLDDSETWPQLIMDSMNASQKVRPVWVGNAGVAGNDAVSHLVLLQLLPGRLAVDMAIITVGGNDWTASLAFEGAPTQAVLEKRAGFQGDLPPGIRWKSPDMYPIYRRLRLFLLMDRAVHNLKLRFRHSDYLPVLAVDYKVFRAKRAASPVVPLPDLSIALKEYRGRLQALASRCKDLELRCLFVTTPTMWRDDLSAADQRLIWQGSVGPRQNPKGYISVSDMARSMDMYMRTLLDVCQESGLECYDLASHIPKDASVTFDGTHLNELGARMVAQNLKDYLLSKPPFAAQK
jgi:lysophospholipase L1-like esterase